MASKIKVDNINKVSDDSNIIKKCGTTITLGASGDSIALATGASQSGFGRTGTVDWVTTPKTATFTAESGKGYFCNTSGGAFEIDLPAGSAGAIISVQDYNNTFDTANLTIDPNGSEKINGGDAGVALVLSTEGQGLTLVYVDSTVGWRSVHSDDFAEVPQTPAYIAATGGSITTSGDYKIHTFTSPGTFCISAGAGPLSKLDYLVVAGGVGGGSGSGGGGGGGAGGFRESYSSPVSGPYTASPIASSTPLGPFTAQTIPVTIGAGGTGSPATSPDTSGNNTSGGVSTFSTITSAGGGFGGSGPACGGDGSDGGSGGGGRYSGCGGAGNTPPTSPAQGTNGGSSSNSGRRGGGAGGGATVAGTNGTASACGVGGTGATTSISTSPVAYAGGGGGAGWTGGSPPMPSGLQCTGSSCGTGGKSAGHPTAGAAGTTNRGGGGGATGNPGSAPTAVAGNGGSGIVIIRYKFQ